MTTEDRKRILEKVVKCFALANDKGATESEAATAAAMAQAMLDRYNLSVADIPNLKKDEAIKSFYLWTQTRWQGWELHMFSNLARVYDCFPYTSTKRDIHGIKKSLSVVGFSVDVEVFKYTFEFLRKTITDLGTKDLEYAKKNRLINSRRKSYDYKFSFCSGCADRIVEKIKEEREIRFQSEIKCRDLVVVKMTDIKRWVKDNMKLGKGTYVKSGHNGIARGRGESAADSISIRPAIRL